MIKITGPVEFAPAPGNPASGATLGQATALTGAEGITEDVLEALEPDIDLVLLFENAQI